MTIKEEEEEGLLTVKEAASYLNVKVSRIYTATFRQEIPHIKIGRLVRFRKEDLNRWISKNLINVEGGTDE
jgi:excisionase family DNA binding protein